MKTRLLTLLALLWLWPGLALAVPTPPDDWVECSTVDDDTPNTTPTGQNRLQGPGQRICFFFDDSWTTTTTFHIQTRRASCNLVQDKAASGGTATVNLRPCPTGSDTFSTTTCPETIKAFTDDDSVNITRGSYLLESNAAAGANDQAVFSCMGYE